MPRAVWIGIVLLLATVAGVSEYRERQRPRDECDISCQIFKMRLTLESIETKLDLARERVDRGNSYRITHIPTQRDI